MLCVVQEMPCKRALRTALRCPDIEEGKEGMNDTDEHKKFTYTCQHSYRRGTTGTTIQEEMNSSIEGLNLEKLRGVGYKIIIR